MILRNAAAVSAPAIVGIKLENDVVHARIDRRGGSIALFITRYIVGGRIFGICFLRIIVEVLLNLRGFCHALPLDMPRQRIGVFLIAEIGLLACLRAVVLIEGQRYGVIARICFRGVVAQSIRRLAFDVAVDVLRNVDGDPAAVYERILAELGLSKDRALDLPCRRMGAGSAFVFLARPAVVVVQRKGDGILPRIRGLCVAAANKGCACGNSRPLGAAVVCKGFPAGERGIFDFGALDLHLRPIRCRYSIVVAVQIRRHRALHAVIARVRGGICTRIAAIRRPCALVGAVCPVLPFVDNDIRRTERKGRGQNDLRTVVYAVRRLEREGVVRRLDRPFDDIHGFAFSLPYPIMVPGRVERKRRLIVPHGRLLGIIRHIQRRIAVVCDLRALQIFIIEKLRFVSRRNRDGVALDRKADFACARLRRIIFVVLHARKGHVDGVLAAVRGHGGTRRPRAARVRRSRIVVCIDNLAVFAAACGTQIDAVRFRADALGDEIRGSMCFVIAVVNPYRFPARELKGNALEFNFGNFPCIGDGDDDLRAVGALRRFRYPSRLNTAGTELESLLRTERDRIRPRIRRSESDDRIVRVRILLTKIGGVDRHLRTVVLRICPRLQRGAVVRRILPLAHIVLVGHRRVDRSLDDRNPFERKFICKRLSAFFIVDVDNGILELDVFIAFAVLLIADGELVTAQRPAHGVIFKNDRYGKLRIQNLTARVDRSRAVDPIFGGIRKRLIPFDVDLHRIGNRFTLIGKFDEERALITSGGALHRVLRA